jgi:hypothetical protein
MRACSSPAAAGGGSARFLSSGLLVLYKEIAEQPPNQNVEWQKAESDFEASLLYSISL